MNIFYLDKDAHTAASYHCDKHVVKMPLETAQMLCTALYLHGVTAPYRPTHVKHPCVLWTARSRGNFLWLCELGKELCKEYTLRYGKTHRSECIILWAERSADVIPSGLFNAPPQAMPDEYKRPKCVDAYRAFYRGEKRRFATWKTSTPKWF